MAKKQLITLATVIGSAVKGFTVAMGKVSEYHNAVVKAACGGTLPEVNSLDKKAVKLIVRAVRAEVQKLPEWPRKDDKPVNEKEARGTACGDWFNRFTVFVRDTYGKDGAEQAQRVSLDWLDKLAAALGKVCASQDLDQEEMTISELVEHLGKETQFQQAFDKSLDN